MRTLTHLKLMKCAACFVALMSVVAVMLAVPDVADAQSSRRGGADEIPPTDRTVSARVDREIRRAVELQDEEDFLAIRAVLTPLLDQNLTAYERLVVNRLLGTAEFHLENIEQTIVHFEAMLATEAATQSEANTFRVQLGQLYLATGAPDEGIWWLELALANGVELNPAIQRVLAQAYYQAGRYEDGLAYAEGLVQIYPPPFHASYALVAQYYVALGRTSDAIAMAEAVLATNPNSRTAWSALGRVLTSAGQDQDAFELRRLMYLNGMLTTCEQVTNLAEGHGAVNTPYQGAQILERAINSGRCDANPRALETLIGLWQAAREEGRATEAAERLGQLTGQSRWFQVAGEGHLAMGDRLKAIAAFELALEVAGPEERAGILMLLGRAYFDEEELGAALGAYQQAANYAETRREAEGWVQFIRAMQEPRRHGGSRLDEFVVSHCRLTLSDALSLARESGRVDEYGLAYADVPERCEP